jgi:hypothetical protein
LSKPTTLERRLALWAPSCRVTAAVRKHAAAAYELGGLHGLALWLQARARLSRLSPVEMQELRELARVLVRQAAPIRKALTEQLKTAAEQQVPASLSWEQRQQLLAQREAQRRGFTTAAAPIITTSAAPVPRGSHSRQPAGECGQRLSKKLDRLLAEVLASGAPEAAGADQPGPAALQPLAEPEALARQSGDRRQPGPEVTNPAAAGDLAVPLVFAGSPAPEARGLQPATAAAVAVTADLHEQVLVAAAHGLLEPELAPQPLPVSIHALEAAWAAEPAGAAAPAELSPRARAIAELGAALLRGDQTITLPAALAAELLEALAG